MSEPKVFLHASLLLGEPNVKNVSLMYGGPLSALAASKDCEFYLSGMETPLVVSSKDALRGVDVQIPLPAGVYGIEGNTLCIDAGARFDVTYTRYVTGSNGTMATAIAAEASTPLFKLLNVDGKAKLSGIPLGFTNSPATIATLSMANTAIHLSGDASVTEIAFRADASRDVLLKTAYDKVIQNAQTVATFRHTPGSIGYFKELPTLSKTVFASPIGINNSNLAAVSHLFEVESEYSDAALEQLLQAGAHIALGGNEDGAVDRFLKVTQVPGLQAAAHATVCSTALSAILNFTNVYREDGTTTVSNIGNVFGPDENWSHKSKRVFGQAGDCDDVTLHIGRVMKKLYGTWQANDPINTKPYTKAFANVFYPYYTPLLCVTSANGPEATGGGGHAVAGHAYMLVANTVDVIKGLSVGMPLTHGELKTNIKLDSLLDRYTNAAFSEDVLARLPEGERSALSSMASLLENPQVSGSALPSAAVEGTCFVTGKLYDKDKPAGSDIGIQSAKRDEKNGVFGQIPAFARTSLHFGGTDKGGIAHQFYRKAVEGTFCLGQKNPFFASKEVQAVGGGISQVAFMGRTNNAESSMSVGATPQELHEGTFSMSPLYFYDTDSAKMDVFAMGEMNKHLTSARASVDAMPSALEVANYTRSYESITKLREVMEQRTLPEDSNVGVDIALGIAGSTLLFNPMLVDDFCKTIAASKRVLCAKIDMHPMDQVCEMPGKTPLMAPMIYVTVTE